MDMEIARCFCDELGPAGWLWQVGAISFLSPAACPVPGQRNIMEGDRYPKTTWPKVPSKRRKTPSASLFVEVTYQFDPRTSRDSIGIFGQTAHRDSLIGLETQADPQGGGYADTSGRAQLRGADLKPIYKKMSQPVLEWGVLCAGWPKLTG
jgi:hypothetical protein